MLCLNLFCASLFFRCGWIGRTGHTDRPGSLAEHEYPARACCRLTTGEQGVAVPAARRRPGPLEVPGPAPFGGSICRAFLPLTSCTPLQVAVVKPDDSGEVQDSCEPQAQEEGAELDGSEQQQKLVTLHMADRGETLVQEAYEEAALGGSELQQITIPFGGTTEYSIITPISEEIQAPGTLYRSALWEERESEAPLPSKRRP